MDKNMKLISHNLKQNIPSGNLRELTLQEVADCFDITRERVRQIEAKALRKMRVKLINKGVNDGLY
jgi:DNA-directed RNA polymerase sigma subunit (sigma70/sigma32)